MSADRRIVQTVAGAIAPEDLGVTMVHEHLWSDLTPLLAVHGYGRDARGPWDGDVAAEARWNPGVHPDNYRLTDVDVAVAELAPYVAAGGRAIVELTPPSLGRDAARVREIAARARVHVILGSGQYLAPVHESWVAASDERTIAARLVADATIGLDGTDIRAGIYGEIGTSDPVTAEELRFLRAVAAASSETELAISIHLHPWGYEGERVLDTLTAAGADAERIVLGHLNTAIDRPDHLRRLLDRGAVLGFDLFGFDHSLLGAGRWPPSDRDVASVIVGLLADGYGDRIVVAQDVGVRTRLRRWGGWGYAHVLEHVVPVLRELGASEADVDAILVVNPARILAVAR